MLVLQRQAGKSWRKGQPHSLGSGATKTTDRAQESFLASPRLLTFTPFLIFFLGPCVSLCWDWCKLHGFLLGVELEEDAHDGSSAV